MEKKNKVDNALNVIECLETFHRNKKLLLI